MGAGPWLRRREGGFFSEALSPPSTSSLHPSSFTCSPGKVGLLLAEQRVDVGASGVRSAGDTHHWNLPCPLDLGCWDADDLRPWEGPPEFAGREAEARDGQGLACPRPPFTMTEPRPGNVQHAWHQGVGGQAKSAPYPAPAPGRHLQEQPGEGSGTFQARPVTGGGAKGGGPCC